MSNPQDYTIGWICAVTVEAVAARAMLDEEHDAPEAIGRNDNNSYFLGRIGRHNVVIAALPDKEYGLTSAASVARDMVRSFHNVRIGLMVGIGGGVPSSKHDIRLGDVVVSDRSNGMGGVFQYDYGKAIQDSANPRFETTGHLNQPPQVLLTAVAQMKAEHMLKGHSLNEGAEKALQAIYESESFCRPPSEEDRLFKSSFIHAKNTEGCKDVCDSSFLVPRKDRVKEKGRLAIHYGLIASANTLMKNATIRDKLAEQHDILCFEMEAAGLMNHFPCLVIRGICDYSDSHKNHHWQGFAALMAAAYAKELLSFVHSSKVEEEKRLGEVLAGITKIKKNVRRLVSQQQKSEFDSVLQWLTPHEFWPQHNDFSARRQEGTGQWLLKTEEFEVWRETKGRILLCQGIPGAGKTILASSVIDSLQTRGKTSRRLYV
ncbi:hypothetical protein CDD80_3760 [Ophiocordyceps camponoti-rufipedis]|uniref:Nephrocystin 3-like N-terminal domain-containing protein n=1 Tax=Ophiocordyceps camponoti-rufipedis TaxID=2004952 RepID=A0A2C5Z0H5_9HYPO|nr:hypothetical protein CDD80_3760 [Ophiocordyceps camponoti-rufipedis]